MSSAKFNSRYETSIDFSEISCTARSIQVDLIQIKDLAKSLFGHGFALAWANKFAFHGLKLKASDFVTYKGGRMTAEEFKHAIRSSENFVTEAQMKDSKQAGLGIDCDKRSVTATRLVRAYAADLSHLVTKGLPVPDELGSLAERVGLEKKYAFLDAAYGMDDKALQKHARKFWEFCHSFDSIISEAYKAGHIVSSRGSGKHSHAESFVNYAKWRGFEIE